MKNVKGHFRCRTVAEKLILGRRFRNQHIAMGAIVCYILIYPEKLFCKIKTYLIIQVPYSQDYKGDDSVIFLAI